jgi:arginyl-tRNA synthetase
MITPRIQHKFGIWVRRSKVAQRYPYAPLIRDSLQQIVASAVARLIDSGALPAAVREIRIEISDTKQPEHGDYACNFAMLASKSVGKNPRELGELLKNDLMESVTTGGPVQSIDVAGPGFLNLRLNPGWVASFVAQILERGDQIAKVLAPPADAKKINVEFVSVNPNGPITIGSGRGAAYGSTLCNVLEAAGNQVHREYYINDGVNSEQMRLFAESVKAIAEGRSVPDNGYKGDYVHEVAKQVDANGQKDLDWYQNMSQTLMLDRQRQDLGAFGTTFDTWFSEQSLHESGAVADEIEKMTGSAVADDKPIRTKLKLARGGIIEEVEIEAQSGDAPEDDDSPFDESTNQLAKQQDNQATLWLRSTKFGDDMDRVLRRRDGRLTYIASDVAYHKDKLLDLSGVRGTGPVDKMITILGPDHHGYIGRLQAVVAAMLKADGMVEASAGGDADTFTEVDSKIFNSAQERDICREALREARQKLEVQIFQLVRFMKDGKPAPMRKRDGNIYALIDLLREIGEKVKPNGSDEEKLNAGKDVARFFYLMRSHDTTFDFDLDLAEKQSDENPVFYVQYAYARICSVIAKAEEAFPGSAKTDRTGIERLTHERELSLIKKICDLPFEVQRCAEDYGVHRLTTYAIELARTFHHFYEACRVIQPEEPELSRARLSLCEATKLALKGVLDLLGVSAPERMDRAE